MVYSKIQQILKKHLIGESEAQDVLEAASEIAEEMLNEITHGSPTDVIYAVGRKFYNLSTETADIYAAPTE